MHVLHEERRSSAKRPSVPDPCKGGSKPTYVWVGDCAKELRVFLSELLWRDGIQGELVDRRGIELEQAVFVKGTSA